jgi:hypothetical protein
MRDITLTSDETRIVSHAVHWVLELPFDYTFAPLLGDADRADLERLRDALDPRRHGRGAVAMTVVESSGAGPGWLRLDRRLVRLMMRAVGSFYGQMLHTTWEYEAVVGLPWRTAEPLMSRLTAFYRSLPGPTWDEAVALPPDRDTSREAFGRPLA